MKRIARILAASALALLFTPGLPGSSQNPPPQNRGQMQKQERQQQHQQKRMDQRQRQMQRSPGQQRKQQALQQQVWQQHRARHWEGEHRTWQQRGGYTGYRIRAPYFHLYYGPAHWFRVYNLPFMVVGGYPRFQYGGYWFVLMDPWPEFWGPSWYETDYCYIDYYVDGYYLFNRSYPGHPGIAVRVVF